MCPSGSTHLKFLLRRSKFLRIMVIIYNLSLCITQRPHIVCKLCNLHPRQQQHHHYRLLRRHRQALGPALHRVSAHLQVCIIFACIFECDAICYMDSIFKMVLSYFFSFFLFRPGVVPGVPVTRELSVHTIELMPNSQVYILIPLLVHVHFFRPARYSVSLPDCAYFVHLKSFFCIPTFQQDQIFVCTNSPQCFILTLQGQLVRRFASGKKEGSGGDFNCATVSPQGMLLFFLGIFFFSIFLLFMFVMHHYWRIL